MSSSPNPTWPETVVTLTRSTPLDATHRSIRSMVGATDFGTSRPAHLAALGLQPHRSETFKLSSNPLFVDISRRRHG